MYRSLLRLSILISITLISFSSYATEKPFIVINAESGSVLAANKPNHRWYPASLTKLMTAYVTFRAIRSGELSAGSPVFISSAATRQPPSRMGYKRGIKLRVDTALKIIIIKSANDVSYALAEAVSGSVKRFVERMNTEAKRLGMINTRFANSNGLHNSGQYTSARDMALLSAKILSEFPEFAYLFAASAVKTKTKTHYSYNLLLARYPGTTGMKTGFICASGYNMVASAQKSGQTLIAVVLGRSSQTDRAVSAARLLTENISAQPIGRITDDATKGANPVNMRPVLCTQEARASRYDPASGTAVIKSEFLSPRNPVGEILTVSTGNIDAPPSDAWISRNLVVKGVPPVPSKRPNYDPIIGRVVLVAIGEPKSGRVAIPTPRQR